MMRIKKETKAYWIDAIYMCAFSLQKISPFIHLMMPHHTEHSIVENFEHGIRNIFDWVLIIRYIYE